MKDLQLRHWRLFLFRIIFVSFAVLCAGCTNTEYTPVPGSQSYAGHGGDVRVLSEFPPEGTFQRLGILVAKGVRLSDKEDLIENLKKEAAERGANAIVLQGDVKVRSGSGGSIEKVLGAYAVRLN